MEGMERRAFEGGRPMHGGSWVAKRSEQMNALDAVKATARRFRMRRRRTITDARDPVHESRISASSRAK
jgi:hypothetical protein